jgi:hypothetical protein
MLMTVAGEFLLRGLIGAGVGVATYKFVVTPVKAQIAQRFSAAGDLAAYIGFLGIDVAVTIILSAWVGRLAVNASKAFFVKRSG